MRLSVSARSAPSHLTVASLAFIAFAIGFGLIQIAWLAELRRPSVTLLGAGSALSLLVTDGDARLLIALGDDPAAFGNSLGRVLGPSQDRLDLVLVAGSGADLRAAAVAVDRPGIRTVSALSPIARTSDLPDLGPIGVIETPRRIVLGSTAVAIDTVRPGGDAASAWRATIEREASRIVVVSDGSAAELFPPVHANAVLVVAGPDPIAAWEASPAPVLALVDAAIPPIRLREAATTPERMPDHVIRVFPGEAVPLVFTAGGVEIPAEPTMTLSTLIPDAIGSPPNP